MRIVLTMLVLSVLSLSAFGQTSRGTVTGTVTDATGAVVAGAKVEIINVSTGIKRSTVSNETGIYRFDGVDLGSYTLNITQSGFKAFTAKDLNVDANRTIDLNTTLEVGEVSTVVEVTASNANMLVKDSAIRGGSISNKTVANLPVSGMEPISLARTLPGVIQLTGGSTFGNGGQNTQFSVNGARPRGNNYLIDGTENNDSSVGGNAQSFNMLDAVQEVSVQTSNYSAEFGRGGGGQFNVVTKGGTNEYHGTAYWQYRSQVFESNTNLAAVDGSEKAIYHRNIYGFTFGGPIKSNKTFFFGGLQGDNEPGTYQKTFTLPSQAGVNAMKAAFPNSKNLDLYLKAIGSNRGNSNYQIFDLGAGRGEAEFGSYTYNVANPSKNLQWLTRIDHNLSDSNQLSFRYIYDSSPSSIGAMNIPGFGYEVKSRSQNFLFSDVWTLSPTWTNEFRFSYGRLGVDFPIMSSGNELGETLPGITIQGDISPLGVQTNMPQNRYANNWLFQETQTKLVSSHTFRYGGEFLKQLARQRAPFSNRGTLTYNASDDYTALANFLDDFSGSSGSVARTFGSPVFYPNMFRQSYFVQDTWKVVPSLTLTVGVRYENYGQPANDSFKYPAFTGFGTLQEMLTPSKANRDNNNFAPTVGLAWSPNFQSGIGKTLFGDGKSVWRAGFQITYDSMFNNILSNVAANTPNAIATSIGAKADGSRGLANLSTLFPASAGAVTLMNNQTSLLDPNLRNPYTERWSLGLQRELPSKLMMDISYIGSGSHKLYVTSDLNPGTQGNRLYKDYGIRRIRSSEGNSIYHAFQAKLERRLANGFDVNAAYTFSKNIDSMSEIFESDSSPSRLNSMPVFLGGLTLDRSVSDYHRKHRFIISYNWAVPGPKSGFLSMPFGGWSITGITTFQSGTPYTPVNGSDRNGDGDTANDRPDISNPNAPINTRAVLSNACASGYKIPNTATCINPSEVYLIEGKGLPNASTIGRNVLFSKGVNNFDMNFMKRFKITEGKTLEYRLETFNIFNHPQYTDVPFRNVLTAPTGRFLNPDFTDAGNRTMRMQLKFIF